MLVLSIIKVVVCIDYKILLIRVNKLFIDLNNISITWLHSERRIIASGALQKHIVKADF